MKIEIKNRYDDSIIYSGECETLLFAVEEAVRNGADLRGANLYGAKQIVVNWASHSLLSEILWRAAEDVQPRQMLTAFVGRRTDWCWGKWATWKHPQKTWALKELAKWITDGDDAPDLVKKYAKQDEGQ